MCVRPHPAHPTGIPCLPALATVFQKTGLKRICAMARYSEAFEKSMRADMLIYEKIIVYGTKRWWYWISEPQKTKKKSCNTGIQLPFHHFTPLVGSGSWLMHVKDLGQWFDAKMPRSSRCHKDVINFSTWSTHPLYWNDSLQMVYSYVLSSSICKFYTIIILIEMGGQLREAMHSCSQYIIDKIRRYILGSKYCCSSPEKPTPISTILM